MNVTEACKYILPKIQSFYSDRVNELKRLTDLREISLFQKKYPFLKRKGKGFVCENICIAELLKYEEFNNIREEVINNLKLLRMKIRCIFKHGQSAKTQISCDKIVLDMRGNKITIAITKNTLLANKQFTTRFIATLKKYGYGNTKEDIKNRVIVLSSENNDLDGYATHCSSITDVWDKIYKSNNTFSVIFVCANSTRINDIGTLFNNYSSPMFNDKFIKPIIVQYDEAANDKYGIPVYRAEVENWLLYHFVEEIIPITASTYIPLVAVDCSNLIWEENELKKNRFNFYNKDLLNTSITSSDENYSSLNDAYQFSYPGEVFDIIKPFDNTIPPELFNEVYDKDKKDYSKHGRLNAHNISLIGDEEQAVSAAKNILDNREIRYDQERMINGEKEIIVNRDYLFKKDEFNLHIMLTPKRKLVTRYLMAHACKQDYKPVVIGLYGSSFHFMYYDSDSNLRKSTREGQSLKKNSETKENEVKEFNDQLDDFLTRRSLKNRCVIVLGNYDMVGESNTFVNRCYGYVRSTICLPGCNLLQDQRYQFMLRSCFLINGFNGLKKNDVVKFMVGPQISIDDAILYEELNDDLVKALIDNDTSSISSQSSIDYNELIKLKNITQSSKIPVKYTVNDIDSEEFKSMREIMGKSRRTVEDKKKFMDILNKAIENNTIAVEDNNGSKIDITKFEMVEFRCYKNKNKNKNKPNNATQDIVSAGNLNDTCDNSEEKNDAWRFKTYEDHVKIKQPLINGELKSRQCGLYCCFDTYTDKNGYVNQQTTLYMLYSN